MQEFTFEHNGYEILLGHDPYGVAETLESEGSSWKRIGLAFRDNGNGYEPDQVFGDETLPGEMLDIDQAWDQNWLNYQAADMQLASALSELRRDYMAAEISNVDQALTDMNEVLNDMQEMTECIPQIVAKKFENTTVWIDLDKFLNYPEESFSWNQIKVDLKLFESLQRGETFYIQVTPLEDRENYELATPVFFGHVDPTKEEILMKLEEYGFEV